MHMRAVYANAAVALGAPRKTLGRGGSVTGLDPVDEQPLVGRFTPKQAGTFDTRFAGYSRSPASPPLL